MCKRNSPRKNKVTMGCVRETPQIKKQKSQHGMCKRNSPHQKKISMGYVRETPTLKKKPTWDV